MNSDLGLNTVSASGDSDARKNRNRSLAAEEREANKQKLAEWKERKNAMTREDEAAAKNEEQARMQRMLKKKLE
jgi:hypothetical protein